MKNVQRRRKDLGNYNIVRTMIIIIVKYDRE
jgi:hypothetical protein